MGLPLHNRILIRVKILEDYFMDGFAQSIRQLPIDKNGTCLLINADPTLHLLSSHTLQQIGLVAPLRIVNADQYIRK